MKNYLRYKSILIIIMPMLLVLSGCGTLMTKNAPTTELDQRGHPYSGVHLDLLMMKCAFYFPAAAKKRTNARYVFSVPMVPILFAVGLVDAPLSLAADTIFLPVDYFVFTGQREPRMSGKCDGEEQS
jgi:uncharacterized protein YceK